MSRMFRPASRTAAGRLITIAAIGLLGTTLMSLLPFAVGFLPGIVENPLSETFPHLRSPSGRHIARALGVAGAIMLFWAWTAVHPSRVGRGRPRLQWGLLCLWGAPTLLAPPLQTADPWAYAAQGWILNQGRNPYDVPMGIPSPFSSGIFDSWLSTTTVYPPISLYIQGILVAITQEHPYWSVVAMRAIPVLAFIIIACVARPLARDMGIDPDVAVWIALLNPLVISQYLGGAHNDSLMSALIVLAIWLARRPGGLWWSALAIGLAAGVKQPAVLAGLGVALHAAWPRVQHLQRRWLGLTLRVAAAGAVGGGLFLAISYASDLGMGWANDTGGSPTLVISHTPVSWVSQLLIRGFGVPAEPVGTIGSVLTTITTIAAIVWVGKRHLPERTVAFTAGTLLAFGLLGAALQPWYPLWGGILLAWVHVRREWGLIIIAATGGLSVSAILQEFWSPAVTVPLCALAAAAWWWKSRGTFFGAPAPTSHPADVAQAARVE